MGTERTKFYIPGGHPGEPCRDFTPDGKHFPVSGYAAGFGEQHADCRASVSDAGSADSGTVSGGCAGTARPLAERLMERLRAELGDCPEASGLLATVALPIAFLPEEKLRELLTDLRNVFDSVLGG